ncbi:selenoprotein domain protein [Purpureocillium lilacinum]|uniref:Selenoprotein domain protein n=1 Tax=Purpureocillium lilacinum TaxID=33203 RepID=A0A2U3EK07_PURLI|nr:selenoprotein domain protein [Purpureocillium lilacinum]
MYGFAGMSLLATDWSWHEQLEVKRDPASRGRTKDKQNCLETWASPAESVCVYLRGTGGMTTMADSGSTSQTAAAAAASSQQRQQDKMRDAAAEISAPPSSPLLPRVTIQFCTQCKWMLRAAYYAQELLSTFGLSLGEVALQPSTGGTFVVTIVHQRHSSVVAVAGAKDQDQAATATSTTPATTTSTVLWDRKVDGGFPETKELKRRVRDVIEPGRDLGHVDRHHGPPAAAGATTATATTTVTGTGPGTTGTVATKGGEVEDETRLAKSHVPDTARLRREQSDKVSAVHAPASSDRRIIVTWVAIPLLPPAVMA